jgi:hypothetical protein
MSILTKIATLFTGERAEPAAVDIPPARTRAGRKPAGHAKKLAVAAVRHGKPFKAHAKVERVEPVSRALQELNQKSDEAKPAPSVIVQIRSKT